MALTDLLGLQFVERRGRFVRVREPVFVSGTDTYAALTAEIIALSSALKMERMRNASLQNELARLRKRHGEAA